MTKFLKRLWKRFFGPINVELWGAIDRIEKECEDWREKFSTSLSIRDWQHEIITKLGRELTKMTEERDTLKAQIQRQQQQQQQQPQSPTQKDTP